MSTEKWCRLRGNLLFYFKTSDPFSEPQGVIVLEQFTVTTYGSGREQDGFVFYIGKACSLKQWKVERNDFSVDFYRIQ